MRDPVEGPNSTRYARGGPRRPVSASAARASQKPKTEDAAHIPAVSEETRSALVAEKLSGFAAVTWDWAQIQAYTATTIEEILAARAVPPENLTSPRLDIAIPAIEAMRYSGLKREFALLIAATMDTERADDAHPSFIEILKQLTSDEVRMLSFFPDPGQVLPFANIDYTDRSGRILSSLRYIVPEFLAEACDRRRALGGYIDNLLRLNLVTAPGHLAIDDGRFYRELLAQPFIAAFEATVPSKLKANIDRRVIALSDFGQMFRTCCIEEVPGAHRALR